MGVPAFEIAEAEFPPPGEISLIALIDTVFSNTAFSNPGVQRLPAAIRVVRTIDIDRTTPAQAGVVESRLIWVGVTEAPSQDWAKCLTRLVDRLPATAFVVEAVGAAAIDWAWAELGNSRCTILGDPTELERSLALRTASAELAAAAYDSGGESHSSELDRLREEVGRIADALASLSSAEADRMAVGDPSGALTTSARHADNWAPSEGGGVADDRRGYGHQPQLDPYGSGESRGGVTSLDIRKMLRMRRLRDKHFPGDMFSDPAWDMLLDLMAARIDRRPVSVSSLCIASAVPATTALRWIKTMTEAGLFERRSDPADGRRVFIALSDQSAKAMHAYFADMLAIGSLLPA